MSHSNRESLWPSLLCWCATMPQNGQGCREQRLVELALLNHERYRTLAPDHIVDDKYWICAVSCVCAFVAIRVIFKFTWINMFNLWSQCEISTRSLTLNCQAFPAFLLLSFEWQRCTIPDYYGIALYIVWDRPWKRLHYRLPSVASYPCVQMEVR